MLLITIRWPVTFWYLYQCRQHSHIWTWYSEEEKTVETIDECLPPWVGFLEGADSWFPQMRAQTRAQNALPLRRQYLPVGKVFFKSIDCTLEGLQTIFLRQLALNNICAIRFPAAHQKSKSYEANSKKRISKRIFFSYSTFSSLVLTFSRPLKLSRSGLGLWHST